MPACDLKCFGYVAGTDTSGTHLDSIHAAIFDSPDFLQIGIPYGTSLVVSVADIVAEAGTFSTDFTFS